MNSNSGWDDGLEGWQENTSSPAIICFFIIELTCSDGKPALNAGVGDWFHAEVAADAGCRDIPARIGDATLGTLCPIRAIAWRYCFPLARPGLSFSLCQHTDFFIVALAARPSPLVPDARQLSVLGECGRESKPGWAMRPRFFPNRLS